MFVSNNNIDISAKHRNIFEKNFNIVIINKLNNLFYMIVRIIKHESTLMLIMTILIFLPNIKKKMNFVINNNIDKYVKH